MWKNLTMGQRAALIKIAVNSGVYNIDDIVNTYNSYAKGGELGDDNTLSPIKVEPFKLGDAPSFTVEGYDDIDTTPLQRPRTIENNEPVMTKKVNTPYVPETNVLIANNPNVKPSLYINNREVFEGNANFYRDDYLYRVNREGRSLTQGDINKAYNNIRVDTGSSRAGVGGYTKDIDIHMANRLIPGEDLSHEYSHALDNSLQMTGLAGSKSKVYLQQAYPQFTRSSPNMNIWKERRAVNTSLRKYFYDKSKGKFGEDLDHYIDKLSGKDIKEGIKSLNTEYLTPEMFNEGNLQSVKEALKNVAYNPLAQTKFTNYAANGGLLNIYGNGGYKPSENIKSRITKWEGSSMKTNRPFSAEAAAFNRYLPKEAFNQLNQSQLDGLFSYSYNVGSGNFNKRVVPVLKEYLTGRASVKDVQNAMWASKDSKLKGLATRRKIERSLFGGDFNVNAVTHKKGKLGVSVNLPKVNDVYIPSMDIINLPKTNYMQPSPLPTIPQLQFNTIEYTPLPQIEVPYAPQEEYVPNYTLSNIMNMFNNIKKPSDVSIHIN